MAKERRRRLSVESQLAIHDLRFASRRSSTLPRAAGGTRSAYGSDGLVRGSERGERFFFWPMGIQSAGQMRQWGRHATAFVGRRHFDDPLLFDSYFVLRTVTATQKSPVPSTSVQIAP